MNHNTIPDNNALILIIMITTIRQLQSQSIKSIAIVIAEEYCSD